MVLCEQCKFYLTTKKKEYHYCWLTDEELSIEQVNDDCGCGGYEPVDSNNTEE